MPVLYPTPSPTLSRKTEQAAAAYIATLGLLLADGITPFTNIYPGKGSLTKSLPAVIAYAEQSKFDDNYSGNGHVTLHVIVKYPMAVDADGVDTVATSDALTAAVFNAFSLGAPGENQKVADQLNLQAVADFTAMTNQKMSEEANAEEGEVWVETLTLDIYAGMNSGM
jgi:hypothetical protein